MKNAYLYCESYYLINFISMESDKKYKLDHIRNYILRKLENINGG